MLEAGTHQLKAELKHGKNETKVLLEEALREYDSQFSHYFSTSIPRFSRILFTCPIFSNTFLFPISDLPPGETLHDIISLTQYDLDKLKPIEKLG